MDSRTMQPSRVFWLLVPEAVVPIPLCEPIEEPDWLPMPVEEPVPLPVCDPVEEPVWDPIDPVEPDVWSVDEPVLVLGVVDEPLELVDCATAASVNTTKSSVTSSVSFFIDESPKGS